MPANFEKSAEATGLEKVSFHSKPKQSCVPGKDETCQEEGQAESGQSKDSRDWGLANTFLKLI